MKTYLITGGCGFIGSNFIHFLFDRQFPTQVINLDNLTYAGSVDNLVSIDDFDNYHFIKGDICDKEIVKSILYKYNPDVIIHFAAESHVDRSIDGPEKFAKTNIAGTLNLLHQSNQWLNESGRKAKNNFRFIHISTDEVYGSLGETGKFSEKTAYDPSSPYSASKASSDHLAKSWFRTFDFPVIITNCSNNYGPFQFPEKLIPLMIINSLKGKDLPIYGNGMNIRDWLYVHDHCRAIQIVTEKGQLGETYNIGGDNEITNIQIVKHICSILDKEIPLRSGKSFSERIVYVDDRPGHDYRYAIDSSKIKDKLGWEPIESFKTGIEKTISWYINNETWWSKIHESIYKQERLGLK